MCICKHNSIRDGYEVDNSHLSIPSLGWTALYHHMCLSLWTQFRRRWIWSRHPSQPSIPPWGCFRLYYHIGLCICEHNLGDGYCIDTLLTTTTPLRAKKPITSFMHVYLQTQFNKRWIWSRQLSSVHTLFRVNSSISSYVSIFVNTIQKEMDMEWTPLNHPNPFKDQQAYNIIYVCNNSERGGDGYWVDLDSATTTPSRASKPIPSLMSLYLWIQLRRWCRWIFSRPSLNCHCPLKGQQVYTIINVCLFTKTIQKEMEVDMETDME